MTNDEILMLVAEVMTSGIKQEGAWYSLPESMVIELVQRVHKAEREKVAKWMIERGYATGHGDTIEELLKELEWQAVEREREACAKVCDEVLVPWLMEEYIAKTTEAIRSRTN